MNSKSFVIAAGLALTVILLSQASSAQTLRVDSVVVKNIIKSDSSWTDSAGNIETRRSFDMNLSFKPMGIGKAQCYIEMSVDNGVTWGPEWDLLDIIDNGLDLPIVCGTTGIVRLRVGAVYDSLGKPKNTIKKDGTIKTTGRLGKPPKKPKKKVGVWDKGTVVLTKMAFRIIARQQKPLIAGNPKTIVYPSDMISDPVPGAAAAIRAGIIIKPNDTVDSDGSIIYRGSNDLKKIYWDALGDGVTDDSTTALEWTWNTTVPEGTGQKRIIVVKAKDMNGLYSAPETLTVSFGSLLRMTTLPAATWTFTMGSTSIFDYWADPPHLVTLTPFKINATAITQGLYSAVMGVNPSYFTGNDLLPVESVTWYDAALFCNALSKKTGLDTIYTYTDIIGTPGSGCTQLTNVFIDYSKHGYRLPTEAEREFAARAGTITAYYWGTSINPAYGWYYSNSGGVTHPVGMKLPNAWGLYDMSGNVWEWCNDIAQGYSAEAQTDPTGASIGSTRILRGGSWVDPSSRLRVALRLDDYPATKSTNYGFRIVLR
ncbi:MAG: formylglycine-generating enzyme family protein [Chitinispirillaceae bacterium]|jgi:formylglycine-generating enzyme required for sulfatase activity|nr:formylglycine-generating enzyme family protein [Chitinispirillaceae bacterium]